ncbi:MAG TPA: hypothetical protein VFN67_40870 [Polyangiales bacterium]|nr:hypothetical protein [Polyangiales bacterium]
MPQKLIALPQSGIRVTPADSYRPRANTEARLSELLEEWPLPAGSRFGCYLIPHKSHFSDLARVVECAVFERFFGDTPERMATSYAAYEEHSLFLLIVDQLQQRAAGTIRIILPSSKGLKSLNDIASAPLYIGADRIAEEHGIVDARRCWDIGTLAVRKEYRGTGSDHMVSLMLYGYLYALMRRRGIKHMVTILDKHAHAQLTQLLGVPIVPLAGSQPFTYLGVADSRASYMSVPSVKPTVEAYWQGLSAEAQEALRPYIARLLYCDGMTEMIEVQEDVERTGRVPIARLMK